MRKRKPVLLNGEALMVDGKVLEFDAVNQEELDGKIDAPQTAAVGEVLTVEEVGEDGKPKKWKTQAVQTEPPDWNENDPTKPGYVKNRTHYVLPTTPIGSLEFTATATGTIAYTMTEDESAIFSYFQSLGDKGEVLKVIVGGKEGLLAVAFDRGHFGFSGVFTGGVQWSAGNVLSLVVQNDFITFNQGDTYTVSFEDTTKPYYSKLDFNYIPDNVYHSENAPVKFGAGENSTVQGELTTATGYNAHAEGSYSKASGPEAHAEGINTKASGVCSHAEGDNTEASGIGSHAEGVMTVANRLGMHSEGKYNLYDSAKYVDVVRLGNYRNWSNMYAASEYTFNANTGYYTLVNAEPKSEVVIGLYYAPSEQYVNGTIYQLRKPISLNSGNLYKTEEHFRTLGTNAQGKYVHVVGNGDSSALSNAYTLDWEGNAWFAGDVYVHSTSGTNKDDGSVRLATEDLLTSCVRLLIRQKKNNDGTITYSSNFPALFVYYEIFKGLPIDAGNSVECCLMPIESESLTVLNYTGMSIDQNSDGNIVLTIRFSSYVSGKQISAEIKDAISGFGTDNENRLSTVVTVTENAYLPSPATAQVGQIVKVKAVDADGKVIETETIPHPVLYVTISKTGNTNTSDKTLAEIKSAYDSGCSVFAVVDSFVLPLLGILDNMACFCATTPDRELHRVSVLITESGVSLAYGSFVEGNQGVENAGKILGIGNDGNVVPEDKPVQALAGGAAPTTTTAGVVGQEYYVIVNNAVTEMYVCTSALIGSYTWDKVEFGGAGMGITGAKVGQIAKITAVDSAGKPTAWEPVDIPNRLDVTVSMIHGDFMVSHKFAEIKAAYDAGRAVQLIDTGTLIKYSLMGFFPGSIEGVTYADFRFIDSGGDIWQAEINSNDKVEFFKGSPFVTLYGDVPQNTPKAITYSTSIGIGYADFIPYIEIPSTGDELKERLAIGPAYFYVMPNAYAPFALKNLVNPYTLTRLSYSAPEFGTEDNTYEASYLVTDSLGQQIKATCQVLLTESGLGDLVWNFEVRDSLIVKSSTEGSTKKFKITVDDSGTISATEITN